MPLENKVLCWKATCLGSEIQVGDLVINGPAGVYGDAILEDDPFWDDETETPQQRIVLLQWDWADNFESVEIDPDAIYLIYRVIQKPQDNPG